MFACATATGLEEMVPGATKEMVGPVRSAVISSLWLRRHKQTADPLPPLALWCARCRQVHELYIKVLRYVYVGQIGHNLYDLLTKGVGRSPLTRLSFC